MSELLVVRSKIKGCAEGCNVSSSLADALSDKVKGMIAKAAERAKGNGRKTLKPIDL